MWTRRRSGAGALAAGVAAIVVACRHAPPAAQGVHRLGADVAWQHCTLAGERRPAAPCAQLRLVASGRDVAVPESGRLEVPLAGGGDGPLLLVSEVLTAAAPPTEPLTAVAFGKLDDILKTVTEHRGLERVLGRDPAFRVIPQPAQAVATLPPTLTLRFAPDDRGRRATYAVWAWPVDRRPRALASVAPRAGQRLRLSLGVQEPAWDGGGPAVRFRAILLPGGGARRTVVWRRSLDPARVAADRGWQEADVDVPALAAPVRLVLAAHARGGASLPVWGRPALVDAASATPARPSLILLSLDTLRADHLGAYGYARKTSPTIDALAGRAVLFEQAVAPFPSTTASHMTMLTSLEPCAHGVLAPGVKLSASIPTVAEQLAAAGYATAAITEDGLIKGDIGFERGFDTYRDLPWLGHEPLGLFTDGIALARAWLARHGREPFFLFLHTYQIHPPYKVPEQYAELFPVAGDASDAARQEAEYDEGLRYADDLVGRFLALLDADGLGARTALLVTADHGIEFGEHGGIGHARGVYEEQIRVPMLILHPRVAAGRRVRGQVGLIDVAPTLLDLAGVPAPPSFAGTSLVPLVLDGGEPAPRELVAEQLWGPRQTVLRTARYAYILKASGPELYDLLADPREQRNLAADEPTLAADGTRRIAEIRASCLQRQLALRAGPTRAAPLDPERTRALRALGYVQ